MRDRKELFWTPFNALQRHYYAICSNVSESLLFKKQPYSVGWYFLNFLRQPGEDMPRIALRSIVKLTWRQSRFPSQWTVAWHFRTMRVNFKFCMGHSNIRKELNPMFTVIMVGGGSSRGPATQELTICRTDLLVAISLQYQGTSRGQLPVFFGVQKIFQKLSNMIPRVRLSTICWWIIYN